MNWRPRSSAIVLCYLGLTISCGGSANRDGRAAVRDSVGTRIVENSQSGWASTQAWQIRSVPTLTIGAVSSSEPEYEFSRVTAATRLSDGRIVVLESQSSEIRWFGPDGSFLFRRGGRGGGPGEFNYASTMHRLSGDTILVENRPRLRHVLFAPDGDLARDEAVDVERLIAMGPWRECISQTLPDRSLLMCRPEPGEPPQRPDPGPGHLRTFSRFVRVPLPIDTVIPLGLEGGLEQWGIDYGGRTRFALHPFHAFTVVASGGAPMELAIAINPAYSIEVWSPTGQLLRIVRRVGARRAPTSEERVEARERMVRFAGDDQVLANRFIAEVAEPDSIPAVTALQIDDLNYLWVLRSTRLASQTSLEADIFDEAGVFLGSLPLPERFRPLEIGEDYVLGVRHDENDVPFVELYRLERNR